MTSVSDRFGLTAEQYLGIGAKYHILTYLEDAVSQLLEHKEENPRVIPSRFFSDYFRSVVQGTQTLFREYNYIRITPHNRASFIRIFFKCFRHIGRNGDLLSVKEYHSLVCLLCPDFPFEPIQKTARIILMDDAMDCLMSLPDFLYAFQTQFFYEEFIDKLHTTYQDLLSGMYRPGQVVVVPTLSRPAQHKQQPQTSQGGAQTSSLDGVDVHAFLEAVLQIVHSNSETFSCPPVEAIKDLLTSVQRVTFYGFLIGLTKHVKVNESIAALPDKSTIMDETDEELNSPVAVRPKSGRPRSALSNVTNKAL